MVTLSEINDAETVRQFPVSMYLGILAFIGFLGNGIVCYIYANVYKNSNSRCFIRWLAAIDLSTCLIAIPIEIVIVRNQYEFHLVWACKVSRFVNSLGTISSVAILVLIAIDRYRKICKPLEWQFSNKVAKILCVCSFFLAVFVSLPNFWLYGIRTTVVSEGGKVFNGTECSISDDWKDSKKFPLIINGASLGMFLIAVFMLIILYSIIGRHVRFFAKKREQRRLSSSLIIDPNNDVSKSIRRRVFELRSQSEDMSESNIIHNTSVFKKVSNSDNLIRNNDVMYKSTETVLSSMSANSMDRKSDRNLPAKKQEERQNIEPRDNMSNGSSCGLSTVVPLVTVNGKNINECQRAEMNETLTKGPIDPVEKSTSGTDTLKIQLAPKKANKVQTKTPDGKNLARSTTYLMFIISVVFVLTFLPYLLLALLRELKPMFVENLTHSGRTAYRFFLRSYFMNCATNPIIYSIFDRRFRSACCQTFDIICQKMSCFRKRRRTR